MLPVCDSVLVRFGGDCDIYIIYIGLRFEVVHESVVNKWEEIFYFRLQRVT